MLLDAWNAPNGILDERTSLSLAHFSGHSRYAPGRADCLFRESEFAGIRGVSATIPKFVSDQKKARRYFVSGTVQGVGYRFFVQRVAEKLDIGGYARNLFDGRVEVLAIGSTAQLDQLKSELERGPRSSSVSGVQEEEAQTSREYEKRFVIEPTV
jgi:acylphosphatase